MNHQLLASNSHGNINHLSDSARQARQNPGVFDVEFITCKREQVLWEQWPLSSKETRNPSGAISYIVDIQTDYYDHCGLS